MKVTVITVCRNSCRFIEEAICSVLSQDISDLEYVIIDGCSEDGTLEVIKSHAKLDSRIRYWSECGRGISHAMNLGLSRASGEIIAFLHSDDYYHEKDTLSRVVDAFESSPGAIWLTGGIREVDVDNREIRSLRVRQFSSKRLLRNNIIFHPATFVRHQILLDSGGFDETLQYAMDYDLWLRLSTHSAPVLLNNELACFRVHNGSISSTNRIEALQEEYLVRKRRIKGPVESIFHALYQKYRLFVEK